ncbi:hypothetical protein COY07_05885, partial [Candidatus Peregrinibacteria bacterium CG_4_10_14_0_2_um_filter_43_11]
LLQKPNLLLPLQNSAHNHQARNAEYFEKAGASIVVPAIDDFVPLLLSLLNDVDRQEKMRHALASLSRPHAAKEIAELILHL